MAHQPRIMKPRTWLAVVAAAPLLLGAIARDADTRARHRAEIERLSAAERERLEKNFAEYRALPDSERQRLRRLHEAIEADRAEAGALGRTLDAYEAWLNKVTPWQRMELRGEADAERRLSIVSRIRQEQREAEQKRSEARGFGRRPPFALLRGKDLAEAMTLIEKTLQLDDVQRRKLEETEGVRRYIRTLTLALTHARDDRAQGGRWPSDDLARRLIETFDDRRQRRQFEEAPPDLRRGLLYLSIERSLAEAWWENDRPKGSQESYVEVLETVTPAERERLERLPPDKVRWELYFKLRRESDQRYSEAAQELWQVARQIFPMLQGDMRQFWDRVRQGGNDDRSRGNGRGRD